MYTDPTTSNTHRHIAGTGSTPSTQRKQLILSVSFVWTPNQCEKPLSRTNLLFQWSRGIENLFGEPYIDVVLLLLFFFFSIAATLRVQSARWMIRLSSPVFTRCRSVLFVTGLLLATHVSLLSTEAGISAVYLRPSGLSAVLVVT